jgi:hypothetical protein
MPFWICCYRPYSVQFAVKYKAGPFQLQCIVWNLAESSRELPIRPVFLNARRGGC